jgi:general secretion pathway protein K
MKQQMRSPKKIAVHSMRASPGIALIAVLWLVSLLTLLATTTVSITTNRLRIVHGLAREAQTTLALESAIRLTSATLLSDSTESARFGSSPVSISVLGTTVSVAVRRESGRIHLNSGDPLLLEAFLIENEWAPDEARAMVARIEDWKDPDDVRRPDGAEWNQYRSAGLPYRPRNAPFESIDELHQVLGGEAVDESLLDSFTVYGQATTVSVADADSRVRAALQRAGTERVDSRTETGNEDALNQRPIQIGEVIRIYACAEPESQKRCRAAVLRLLGKGDMPWQVFAWH